MPLKPSTKLTDIKGLNARFCSSLEKIGYSKINVVKNDEIPDIEVNNYIKKYKNDEGWNLETESYILEK